MRESIKLEILKQSYWEHFKYEKDVSLILHINHTKRIRTRAKLDAL